MKSSNKVLLSKAYTVYYINYSVDSDSQMCFLKKKKKAHNILYQSHRRESNIIIYKMRSRLKKQRCYLVDCYTCCLDSGLKQVWYWLSSTFRRWTVNLRASFSSTSSWACCLKFCSSAWLPASATHQVLHIFETLNNTLIQYTMIDNEKSITIFKKVSQSTA